MSQPKFTFPTIKIAYNLREQMRSRHVLDPVDASDVLFGSDEYIALDFTHCLLTVGGDVPFGQTIWHISGIVAFALTENIDAAYNTLIALPSDCPDHVIAELLEKGALMVADMRAQDETPVFPALYSHEEFELIPVGRESLSHLDLNWRRLPSQNQIDMMAQHELWQSLTSHALNIARIITHSKYSTEGMLYVDLYLQDHQNKEFASLLQAMCCGYMTALEKRLVERLRSADVIGDMRKAALMRHIHIYTAAGSARQAMDASEAGVLYAKLEQVERCWTVALPPLDFKNMNVRVFDKRVTDIDELISRIELCGHDAGVDIMLHSLLEENVPLEHVCANQDVWGNRERLTRVSTQVTQAREEAFIGPGNWFRL